MVWRSRLRVSDAAAGAFHRNAGRDLGCDEIVRRLRRCGRASAVCEGQSIHAQLIKQGGCADVFVSNNLIAMYVDLGFYSDAQRVFSGMPKRNVVSWTAMISAHTRAGDHGEAIRVFKLMLDRCPEEANHHTYSAALKACGMAGNRELGEWIHERAIRGRQHLDMTLMNSIVDMYIKCGSLSDARRVFDELPLVNSTSWNTMIAGYMRSGDISMAELLFRQAPEPDIISYNTMLAGYAEIGSMKALGIVRTMHEKGFKLDGFTFPCALKTCGALGDKEMGRQIHGYATKCGYVLCSFTGCSLIDMYSKCGSLDDAIKLHEDYLSGREYDGDILPLCNSMISGYVVNGHYGDALRLLSKIHKAGVGVGVFALSSTLRVCIIQQNMRIGRQVHCLVIVNGYFSDNVIGSILMDLYAGCGNLEDAIKVFCKLPDKDVIAWTSLVATYVQRGSNQLAFFMFKEMIDLNLEIDQFVVANILKACSLLAWTDGGKQVHAYSIKLGFEPESIIVALLIDFYSKCGDNGDASRIFANAVEKDSICWTAMIVGYANNGRAIAAMELYQNMLNEGVEPNKITFLGLLSACRHAGLVTEACNYYKSMIEQHRLTPCTEHYHCMVDILSRAGRFTEARQLISEMPYDPDETTRSSLLCGLLMHQDSEVGKVPMLDVYPASPHNSSDCVTLSNIYASQGMWEISATYREISKRVHSKVVGKSWVQVGH